MLTHIIQSDFKVFSSFCAVIHPSLQIANKNHFFGFQTVEIVEVIRIDGKKGT